MAQLKTQKTEASAADFIAAIPDATRRADAKTVAAMMKKATGASPKMWGPSIVGFGSRKLVYPSGRELDWMLIGFSPRKAALVLYLAGAVDDEPLRARLGKHKTGKGCLYITKLADVDAKVLAQLITASAKRAKAG